MKNSWKECLLMFDDVRSCERVVALRKTMMHAEKYVYFRIDSVSRSGLSRTMAVYIVINGSIRDITQEVAILLGYYFNREKWLMRVNGCGTDMVYHTLMLLAEKLGIPKSNRHWNNYTIL